MVVGGTPVRRAVGGRLLGTAGRWAGRAVGRGAGRTWGGRGAAAGRSRGARARRGRGGRPWRGRPAEAGCSRLASLARESAEPDAPKPGLSGSNAGPSAPGHVRPAARRPPGVKGLPAGPQGRVGGRRRGISAGRVEPLSVGRFFSGAFFLAVFPGPPRRPIRSPRRGGAGGGGRSPG